LNWNFRLACELAHYTPKGLEAGRIFPWSMFSRSSEAKAPAWKARRALQRSTARSCGADGGQAARHLRRAQHAVPLQRL